MELTPELLKSEIEARGWDVSSVGWNDEESIPAAIAYCFDVSGKHYTVYAFQEPLGARVEIAVAHPLMHNDGEIVAAEEAGRWEDALSLALDEL